MNIRTFVIPVLGVIASTQFVTLAGPQLTLQQPDQVEEIVESIPQGSVDVLAPGLLREPSLTNPSVRFVGNRQGDVLLLVQFRSLECIDQFGTEFTQFRFE